MPGSSIPGQIDPSKPSILVSDHLHQLSSLNGVLLLRVEVAYPAAGHPLRPLGGGPGAGPRRRWRGTSPQQSRAGRRHPGCPGTNGPPHGVPRREGRGRARDPGGESIRTHPRAGRNRRRVILSYVPRGNQFARQWQLLLMIDHPAGFALDNATRKLDCTVLQVLPSASALVTHAPEVRGPTVSSHTTTPPFLSEATR